jgi:hypothetical protein
MTETPPLDAKDFADYLRQHATSQRPNVRAELERIADGTEALRRALDDVMRLVPDGNRATVIWDRARRALGADAAPEPAAPPDTSQEWAKLDGATAFLLIDRHAEDWAQTGRMMDAWRAARVEREVRETCQWASHLMSSHMRPRFDNEDTAEIERCITALDALAANKPQEPAPVASARLRATVRARPLNGTLDDYWSAPGGEGPHAYTWSDKPHRLLYDLIGALLYYTKAGA